MSTPKFLVVGPKQGPAQRADPSWCFVVCDHKVRGLRGVRGGGKAPPRHAAGGEFLKKHMHVY